MEAEQSMRVAVGYGEQKRLAPYERALRAAGLETVGNPRDLSQVAGLLLSGGTDVDPSLYNQDAHTKTEPPDVERDSREIKLIHEALDRDLPMLAICRGLQLWNVVEGGTLIQHLEEGRPHEVRTPEDPSRFVHAVQIQEHTRLAEFLGAGEYFVNSRHHQAVATLGSALVVSAISPEDGIVEAMERPDKRFALAVQWHAEDLLEKDRRLFEAFAAAVRG